jgi:diguanylate cyclase (GGDEF)-like protein/PAS domain S-box-containing protein
MKDFNSRNNEISGTISSLQELMEKLNNLSEAFLKQEESLYVISEFGNDWEYWQAPDGSFRYVSPSTELITGYKPDDFYQDIDLIKKIIVDEDWDKWLIHSHDRDKWDKVEPIEFKIITKNGEEKWIHHVCRNITGNNDENLGIRGSNREITELKAIQKKLEHAAGHDPLTGLVNRFLFIEHLKQHIKDAQRNNWMFAVVFIDLDGFKGVNDTLGHNAGDHVLKKVASELQEGLRKEDIIARFGGDEFVGVFNITSPVDSAIIHKKILSQINPTIECRTFELTIHLSIGISIFPQDGITEDQLLKKADENMYRMKEQKKGQCKH